MLLKPIRLLCGLLVIGFLAAILAKGIAGFRHSHERGRMVASLVDENFRSIREYRFQTESITDQLDWPDDFLNLERWLVVQFARGAAPDQIQTHLIKLMKGHLISPVMTTSLARWQDALSRWSKTPAPVLTPANRTEFLRQGRQRFYEAAGYERIGRQYDAAVLYLWASWYMTRFIDSSPFDLRVPQALYFLGGSLITLRHALPDGFRGDRILNLCSEMYPDSIWAEQSNHLWRSEIGNGV